MRSLVLSLISISCLAQIEQRVYNTLLCEGIDEKTAKIITAHAAFESGFFKNDLTKSHNNIFAILHNPCRATYSLGGEAIAEIQCIKGYAQFNSIEDAVKDFVIFLKYRKIGTKFRNFYEYALILEKKNYYGYPDKEEWQWYGRSLEYCHKKLFK